MAHDYFSPSQLLRIKTLFKTRFEPRWRLCGVGGYHWRLPCDIQKTVDSQAMASDRRITANIAQDPDDANRLTMMHIVLCKGDAFDIKHSVEKYRIQTVSSTR